MECGRNVISASVGKVALNDGPRLESLSDIVISMLYGIEGASEGNRPLALELAPPPERWSGGECDLGYWRWGSGRDRRWRGELCHRRRLRFLRARYREIRTAASA
jgi:hypothetical protein